MNHPINHRSLCDILLLAAGMMLVSCSGSSPSFQQPAFSKASFGVPFKIGAREPWHRTGLLLTKGQSYHITGHASADYQDSTQPCTADGPIGVKGQIFNWLARDARCPLNPIHWIGPGAVKHLRVLKDDDGQRGKFLTLIAAITKNDTPCQQIVVGSDRTFLARANGELIVFANDWPGLPQKAPVPADYFGCDHWLLSKSYDNNSGTITVIVRKVSRQNDKPSPCCPPA